MQSPLAYVQFMVALIVIVDPFFTVPLFLGVTSGYTDRERTRAAAAIGLTVFGVLTVTALTGESVLRVLGTSFASFQVGGGLVLLLMAVAMLNPGLEADLSDVDGEPGDEPGESLGVVPLGVPLLAGPGAIGTVIIAAGRGVGWDHRTMIVLCIGVVALIVWGALRLAVPLGYWMGRIGTRIATRLLGLLLAAIAVEYMARGLRQLFPPLAG